MKMKNALEAQEILGFIDSANKALKELDKTKGESRIILKGLGDDSQDGTHIVTHKIHPELVNKLRKVTRDYYTNRIKTLEANLKRL